jgi:hypothetical protein
MANSIALFKKYIDKLDAVYKYASKTSVLDTSDNLVTPGLNAGEFIIPKITMDGLANYSRNSGYTKGDVNLTNETVKADFDRGRSFNIDRYDNAETAGVAFGTLSSEFIRTKVVPELDAYRMAKYAAKAGTSKTGTLADGAAVITALRTAMTAMNDLEVPEETRYLFITSALLDAIRDLDTTKSRAVIEDFGGRVVTIPQSRFYTVIDQYDGATAGETAGGYIKDATSGQNINFMIIEKGAVIQHANNTVNKVISPDDNQDADAWKFCYRSYGIASVYENKTAGIYLHSVA